ncbi:MAG: hypothetical protein IT362_11215 [Deltaproteobacteria bacterium]|nr:hypothetical protein [Deltaproteobacteria bacterium]
MELEALYLWVDGIYVKAGLEKDKAVLLVVIAALQGGPYSSSPPPNGYPFGTTEWIYYFVAIDLYDR